MFCGEGSLEVWDQASPGPSPGRWANIRACSRKFWGHWSLWGTHPSLSSPLPGIRFQEGDGHGLAMCPDLCGHLGPLRRVVEPHRPGGMAPATGRAGTGALGWERAVSLQGRARGTGAGERTSEAWPWPFTLRALGSKCLESSLEGWEWETWDPCALSPGQGAQPCTCPGPACPHAVSPAAVSRASRELPSAAGLGQEAGSSKGQLKQKTESAAS